MFRDMIFIDDLVKKIISILKINETGIYNICSGKAMYLEDLAYLALKDFCREMNFETNKFKLNFSYQSKPDGEIIESILEPTTCELYPQDSYCN
jgi:nucleoside-diphosphate-sugar epimerase